ncbi:MAG TPA: enolase C-terminal domain-like protein [Nocardioides sp.]|uniref:enolase C-terminal domain-like protein n=1 Tax=Nocardioides sp. TaxID=35761 RepID=UPI002E316D38|nr:enolase C-terminal domain-like protein [Nocardioides sp.]HEX5087592.1 enolase C-terminal domain-like protein [Nocardioides sp.]
MSDGPVVSGVRPSAYEIPTDVPEADGTLEWDSTTLVLVEVDGAGRTGIGWTYAPSAAAVVVEDLLGPAVTGRCALDVEAAWSAMVRAVRNAGRPGLVGMALSAVDIALWDLAGRLLEQSLPELWGATPASVELYGSGGFTSYDHDRLDAQVAGWLEAGFDKVKIKIGESWGSRVERDLARTAQVRRLADESTSEPVEVFVDANGGYGRDQACEVGTRLDDLGVSWFEEPVSSDDHDGLDAVRSSVRADVAAGEYGSDLAYAVHLAPHVDCLQLDVTRCGGYTEWRRIAADPALAGTDLSGHCAPYLSLPVAAVTPRLRHVEYFHDHVRVERSLFDGWAEPHGGRLLAPSAPGHGLTVRARDAARHRVR